MADRGWSIHGYSMWIKLYKAQGSRADLRTEMQEDDWMEAYLGGGEQSEMQAQLQAELQAQLQLLL